MTQPHFELRQSFRKFPLHRQVGIPTIVFFCFFLGGRLLNHEQVDFPRTTGAVGIDEDGFVCPNASARHDLAHALGRRTAQKKLGGRRFLVMIIVIYCDVLKLPAAYFLRSCWKNLFPSLCWEVHLSWPAKRMIWTFTFPKYFAELMNLLKWRFLLSESWYLSSNLPKVMPTLGSRSPNIQSHCFGSQDLST